MTGECLSRERSSGRVGRDRLAADLRALGLRRGQDLLIHCSLRQVGHVFGGPATVLSALADVAGPDATLVVPTQTAGNSLSSDVFRAATAGLGAEDRAQFIAAMPGFDPVRTPSAGMGAFAEHVRTRRAARRSGHPQSSFAALGPRADACVSVHDLRCHLGERSPLRWLYDADAAILLLGVGYGACTAFHLAEYRLPGEPPMRTYHCFTDRDGTRIPHQFRDIALDDGDFELLGAALDSRADSGASGGADSVPCHGLVGSAASTLVSIRAAVDFACTWLAAHRGRGPQS
jgi:aminoglycoside 3-N-acetyltransferase